MATSEELYNTAITEMNKLMAKVNCVLKDADAAEVLNNMTVMVNDLETKVDTLQKANQKLTAEILLLKDQL